MIRTFGCGASLRGEYQTAATRRPGRAASGETAVYATGSAPVIDGVFVTGSPPLTRDRGRPETGVGDTGRPRMRIPGPGAEVFRSRRPAGKVRRRLVETPGCSAAIRVSVAVGPRRTSTISNSEPSRVLPIAAAHEARHEWVRSGRPSCPPRAARVADANGMAAYYDSLGARQGACLPTLLTADRPTNIGFIIGHHLPDSGSGRASWRRCRRRWWC